MPTRKKMMKMMTRISTRIETMVRHPNIKHGPLFNSPSTLTLNGRNGSFLEPLTVPKETEPSALLSKIERLPLSSQLTETIVKPDTNIFSDKWSAYFGLDGEFKHYVVVHQRRFVKYVLLNGREVLKVTTNHIERIRVDLRQILRGVPRSEIPKD